ncbi:xanthine dehydrogenase family protein molybdopterin-binding subunit [Rhizobacter sp. Root1221]|uniref:xanthine dehydrogenase family protein molybdopterin-binding subunit n=1 Tax=Rhizobacter sp. Root1221 TaxID=1736433 RepID=UPI000701C613|nr:xanthine dehydrogenase family protein molybdopterin-binding subunit [Rhizobacter sp. Root1221]KQV99630.1 twin-arginine translocation pathway signal protein [Rhizobacter sp. Root1221]
MTQTITIINESRRHFLQGTGALTLAVYLPRSAAAPAAPGTPVVFEPNAFVRVAADDSVTVISKHLEMGQGTYTGLATIVAEELDAAWSQVRVEAAPADARRYNNLRMGPMQGTGGSTAMANSWEQLRRAGASARAMLVSAAAQQWQVSPAEISVSQGVVSHAPTQRQARFGQLAAAAAAQPVPADVKLKAPQDFRLIGKHAPRKDSLAKTNGSARFTQDVHLPGMLTAVVAHSPRFGGKVKSFDPRKALAVKGVVEVVQIPTGVAVVAKDTWTAKKGRDALQVIWDDSAAFKLGSEQIFQRYHELAQKPGAVARQDGAPDHAFAAPARVLKAAYDFPYLAHATMEPMNCVVRLGADGCEIWNGEQSQTADQMSVATLLGLKPEQVSINMLFAGGSFGRRASTASDYVLEAVHIAKALRRPAPVKLVWLREDDMRGGYYRPAFHHALEAAIDAQGQLTGWRHRLVGQSILAGTPFAMRVRNGVDPVSVEGAATLPYAIANLHVDLHTPTDVPVPVLWWRSVGSTHTAYSTETFIDEVATATSQDPVAFRLPLLAKHPRHAGVLKLAAEKAGWDKPLAAGGPGDRRGRGVAVHEAFGSFVAHVAEVTVKPDGSLKVDRIVSAVDCGIAINPDNVRAQVEGSVGFALSAALHGEITLKDGAVEQSNFHDYAPIRINEMPRVEVHLLASAEAPSGMGEPAVPPVAPAVANAIAAATGKRLRRLPFDTELLKS